MAALHQLIASAFRTISLYFSLLFYLALFNLPRVINTISSSFNFLRTKRPLKQHSFPAPNSDQETRRRPSLPASAGNECAVCLSVLQDKDEAERGVRQLRCGHAFHEDCLHAWLTLGSSTCPLCRIPLSPSSGRDSGLRRRRPYYGQELEFDDSCIDDEDLFSFLDY